MKQVSTVLESKQPALQAYIKLMRAVESVNHRIEWQEPLKRRVTISQFAVLEALYFHGPMKQVEIARKVLKTPGNLTMVIDNLVKSALVSRRPSKEDRRANTIELTAEGEEVISQVFPHVAEAIAKTFSVLDAHELSELSKLLKKLGRAEKSQDGSLDVARAATTEGARHED
ncbi:MAG: MarR family winged helix-turn-helix transcriptional regulator [Spirochaetota bacterium]